MRQPRTMSGDIGEILDRVRRIETRLTGQIKGENVVRSKRPQWDAETGTVHVPSASVALDAVLETIPQDYTGNVEVVINSRKLCAIASI